LPPLDRLARALLGLAAAAACASPSHTPDPAAQSRADELLRPYSDQQELSRFVGALPSLCVKGSPATELCQWTVGAELAGWRPRARAIDTGDRVNLICELPSSGAPRAAGSCTIHPRRSNRYSWKIPSGANTRTRTSQETAAQARERHRQTAERWMAEADTVVALSRLMGAIPDQCVARSKREEVCLWRTDDQTFGHGTLAMWIGASVHKKIRLSCVLPSDGGRRGAGSCSAEVGD
jgi:hypothetical protein